MSEQEYVIEDGHFKDRYNSLIESEIIKLIEYLRHAEREYRKDVNHTSGFYSPNINLLSGESLLIALLNEGTITLQLMFAILPLIQDLDLKYELNLIENKIDIK